MPSTLILWCVIAAIFAAIQLGIATRSVPVAVALFLGLAIVIVLANEIIEAIRKIKN